MSAITQRIERGAFTNRRTPPPRGRPASRCFFLQPTTPSWAADPPGRGPPKGSWGIPAKLAGAKTEGFQNGKCVVLRGFNFLFQILAENPNAVKFRLFFAGFQIAAGTPPPRPHPWGVSSFPAKCCNQTAKGDRWICWFLLCVILGSFSLMAPFSRTVPFRTPCVSQGISSEPRRPHIKRAERMSV